MAILFSKVMLMVNRVANNMYTLTDIAVEGPNEHLTEIHVGLMVEIMPGIKPAFKVMVSVWDPDAAHNSVGIDKPFDFITRELLVGLLLVLRYNHQCRKLTSFGYNEFTIPTKLVDNAPIPDIMFIKPDGVCEIVEALRTVDVDYNLQLKSPSNAQARIYYSGGAN